MLPFAETILFRHSFSPSGKMPGGGEIHKAQMRFGEAIWWGKSLETNEHVVGTLRGVTTARTIRRLPEGSGRTRTSCWR